MGSPIPEEKPSKFAEYSPNNLHSKIETHQSDTSFGRMLQKQDSLKLHDVDAESDFSGKKHDTFENETPKNLDPIENSLKKMNKGSDRQLIDPNKFSQKMEESEVTFGIKKSDLNYNFEARKISSNSKADTLTPRNLKSDFPTYKDKNKIHPISERPSERQYSNQKRHSQPN